MGAAREMYESEKLVQTLYQAMPNLIINVWYAHSHDVHHMREDIDEQIKYARETLDRLEAALDKEGIK